MAGLQVSSPKNINDNGNGLILYNYFSSFYSRKVVFALHEKKLKFKCHMVDLFQGEQYEPWFIKLNPKCEVPVLKDGVKIIPDSRRIIDYLEDNFSNGGTPRLIPEKGSPQFQTMERMRDLLDNAPIVLVTYGCISNPQITGSMQLSDEEIKKRQGLFNVQQARLSELCEKYPDHSDLYMSKKVAKSKLHEMIVNPSEVEIGVQDMEYTLKEVEKVLSTHTEDKKDWWLCSERFTIADISLAIVLHRVYEVGLHHKFFKDNNYPCIQVYYQRILQRDSFQRTINQGTGVLKAFNLMDTRDQVFTVGGVAAVICAAGVAALLLINRHK